MRVDEGRDVLGILRRPGDQADAAIDLQQTFHTPAPSPLSLAPPLISGSAPARERNVSTGSRHDQHNAGGHYPADDPCRAASRKHRTGRPAEQQRSQECQPEYTYRPPSSGRVACRSFGRAEGGKAHQHFEQEVHSDSSARLVHVVRAVVSRRFLDLAGE